MKAKVKSVKVVKNPKHPWREASYKAAQIPKKPQAKVALSPSVYWVVLDGKNMIFDMPVKNTRKEAEMIVKKIKTMYLRVAKLTETK